MQYLKLATALGGSGLLYYGLRRRTRTGYALALAGGWLAYRSLARGSPVPESGCTRDVVIEETIRVNRPREEVYRFWRRFDDFPAIMHHIYGVDLLDSGRSRWTARIFGTEVSWEAILTEEKPLEKLGWQSLRGVRFPHSGTIQLRESPNGWGTQLHVKLCYRFPGGPFGSALAGLMKEIVARSIRRELQRVKRYLETVEIPLTRRA